MRAISILPPPPLAPRKTEVPPAPPQIPPAPPPTQDRSKQIAALRGQIEALKQSVSQLELKKRDGEMQLTRLDSELFAMKTDVERLDQALTQASAGLKAASDKLAALKAKLGTVPEPEKPLVQQEIDRTGPEVTKLTADIEDLTRKKTEAAQRLAQKTADRAKLVAEINGYAAAIQQHLGQLMRLEAALRQLESVPPPAPGPAPAPDPSGWFPPG